MDSLQILHVAWSKLAYTEEKNIVSIATPILVAMVMHSWKNMDYIIRNTCH